MTLFILNLANNTFIDKSVRAILQLLQLKGLFEKSSNENDAIQSIYCLTKHREVKKKMTVFNGIRF